MPQNKKTIKNDNVLIQSSLWSSNKIISKNECPSHSLWGESKRNNTSGTDAGKNTNLKKLFLQTRVEAKPSPSSSRKLVVVGFLHSMLYFIARKRNKNNETKIKKPPIAELGWFNGKKISLIYF